jgi:GntR family transcriptional repressor for pyruvate dehydrogenase complex
MNTNSQDRRPIKRSEIVAREIVQFMAEGFKAGEMLPREAQMLEQFQVGRGSLREALRLLEVQGLIAIKPGLSGGPVVGRANARDLGRTLSLFFRIASVTYGDVAEALLVLCPTVARLAASNPKRAETKKILDSCLRAGDVKAKKSSEMIFNLAQFHSAINQVAENPAIAMLTEALESIFREHVAAKSDATELIPHCKRDHQKIAKAIHEGNEKRAAELSETHIRDIVAFHRKRVPGLFDEPIEWR